MVAVTGVFDDVRSSHIRILEAASKYGRLRVLIWPDDAVRQLKGRPPKFPEAERLYFLRAVRYVDEVRLISGVVSEHALPDFERLKPDLWVVDESSDSAEKRAFCESRGLSYRVLRGDELCNFPDASLDQSAAPANRKKVIVTGCYDWFHSGHVRFFEEVSAYGDLYVVVGHDANIRLLKGPGHPLVPQEERRYLAGSIRYVKQALVSTGDGWLDAQPEIDRLKPDIYAVNEDGDKGGKRDFCRQHGIEYLVLKRTPAPGLPPRSSTSLRGF